MNYYELLGIKPSANETEIRQAYMKESLKFHPDRNNDPGATAQFQKIAEAYSVLSDKSLRSKYDASLQEQGDFKPTPVDSNELFSTVFDDLLIPEVPNPSYWYQPIGAVAGTCLGMIVFNIPGALAGYYFGSKMGKVRDMKGKCVYEAFTSLSKEKRTQILTSLAQQVVTGLALGAS